MLKHLNPLLSADLLHALRAMGHGDEIALVDASAGRSRPMGGIERHAFYERARKAYAVVATGERRPYGCIILIKGVIKPDGSVWW